VLGRQGHVGCLGRSTIAAIQQCLRRHETDADIVVAQHLFEDGYCVVGQRADSVAKLLIRKLGATARIA